MSGVIVLPYPPVLNHYYYHRGVKRVLSAEGRAYKLGAMVRARSQGAKLIEGRVYLGVTLFRRANRGDIDGPLKCLFDSLQGVLFKNDSQIRELHVLQLEDSANPRVHVKAEPWVESEKAR